MGTGLALPDFVTRTILPKADVDALTSLSWSYAGDTYATDVQAETGIGDIPSSGSASTALPAPTITGITLTLSGEKPLSENDTNFATVNVYKRSAGGARTLVATGTTKVTGGIGGAGTLSPGVRYALALQASSFSVAYGDQITVEILKASGGVILPALAISVSYSPTFIDGALVDRWDWIWSRLAKRYVEQDPAPPTVLRWQTDMVTWDCYRRRGYTPGSAQDENGIDGAKNAAETACIEAANGKDGLVELAVKPAGVSVGAPLAYTETSPYVGGQIRATNGSREDGFGRGTGP